MAKATKTMVKATKTMVKVTKTTFAHKDTTADNVVDFTASKSLHGN